MRKVVTIFVLLFVLIAALPVVPAFGQEEGDVTGAEESAWLEALNNLDSYRYLINMTAEGAMAEEMGGMGNFGLEGAYTRDPEATHLIMTTLEEASAVEEMPCGKARCEYIVIGNEGWFYDEEADTWTYDTTAPMATSFIGPAFFLGIFLEIWPTDLAPEKEHEDLDGVDTSYYRWTPAAEELEEMALGAEGEVIEVVIELWIATDLNYSARALMTISGTDAQGREGKATIQIDVFDVNTDITIELPEGAEAAPSLPDIPTMPDATNIMPMGGMVIYETASSVEEVVDFYRQEMLAQGWTEDEETAFVTEDMAALSFTKDSQTTSILVSVAEGQTQVMIMTE